MYYIYKKDDAFFERANRELCLLQALVEVWGSGGAAGGQQGVVEPAPENPAVALTARAARALARLNGAVRG